MFIKTRADVQKGFSLIELMVALTLGLLVVGGVLALYLSTATTQKDMSRMTELNQELRAIMNMVMKDLRRAGTWGIAEDVAFASRKVNLHVAGASGNKTVKKGDSFSLESQDDNGTSFEIFKAPLVDDSLSGKTMIFMDNQLNRCDMTINSVDSKSKMTVTVSNIRDSTGKAVTSFIINNSKIDAKRWTILNPFGVDFAGSGLDDNLRDGENKDKTTSCILFTYDLPTGTKGAINSSSSEPNENFGFRLNGTDIQFRENSDGNCENSTSWQRLNDQSRVEISEFTITDNSPVYAVTDFAAGLQTEVRHLTVRIAGRLKNTMMKDTDRLVVEDVKIRNNPVF